MPAELTSRAAILCLMLVSAKPTSSHNSLRFSRRLVYEAYGVALLFLLFAVQLVHVARVYSATWDEPHHLYDGYNIWTRHDYRVNAEVPPLVKLVAALPLLGMHLDTIPVANQGRAFQDGRVFVFDNGGDRVLFPARMACMIFALLLAGLVWFAARSMFGRVAALVALGLLTFDPLLLANGTLVTTDVGSACFIFATAYAFYRYARSPSLGWLAATGLAVGFALVAKYTGALVAPILLLLALYEGVRTRSFSVLARRLAACVAALACGWVILWAFYGFRSQPAPEGLALAPPLAPYIQSMPNPRNAAELSLVARAHLLPEAYIWGLANTKKTEWEYTSYFFGHVYRHGPWQYFPAAFLIKSTLPLLLLLVLFPVLRRRSGESSAREIAFLLIPVGVYFAVVTGSHFDIGARHLMPIYPFLYILAAAGAAGALRCGPLWAAVVGALLTWQVVTSVRVAPDYMAYGNEAWGGPSEVHRYLSDANVDWGQQLKAVKQYLADNHITNCWFAYFPDGAIEYTDYGVSCRRLPTANSLGWMNLPMEVPPVIEGTVLISDSDLAGIEFGDGTLNPYESFRQSKPVAVIQHGVNVYQGRFAVPLASALLDARKSDELEKAGQRDAARAVASRAVELASNSANTQLNLAEMLARQARWVEAIPHYQAADRLVRTVRPDLQQEQLGPGIDAGLAAARKHVE